MKSSIRFSLFAFAIYAVSCKPVPVSHWFPVTPQEHYEKELYKAKLEKTVAGERWFQTSKKVLSDSLYTIPPHQERFYLNDLTPAQAIQIKIPKGRKMVVTPNRADMDTVSRLFLELYRIKTNGKSQRIGYLKEAEQSLTYENKSEDTLLLRIQTGLNESLSVSVAFTTLPILDFPVDKHKMSDVISFWGAQRDGGARSHEGIDIKAKRGTPVLASANGFVTQAGTNNLGGKVVFLSVHDSPYSLYYAHLDSQFVSFGKRVIKGDTLGLVGNTGNAITTAPHLHFGIYSRNEGAVDPLAFIDNRTEKVPGLPERSKWLGDSVKIRKQVNLFGSPQLVSSSKIRLLSTNTTLKIIGEIAKGYRVELSDGTKGYIPTVPLETLSREVSLYR
jgi:murein DD-endopeptidase MepM/ murein hydrolase activator NlpD